MNQPATPRIDAPSIGECNQGVMDALTRAKRIAIILARHGYSVLDISVGNRNARITLKASPRCAELDGAEIRYIRCHGGEQITMAANIEGVQVQWTMHWEAA